jgi:soluble cytochrome b562
MVRDISKLMLRAFNAEADNLVRTMKPHKLSSAIDRLNKVAETIERLGKTMSINIANAYLRLRITELELTADFINKEAEEKEAERVERERLREERKAQQEIERERAKLEKEQKHYENALAALAEKGDAAGVARLQGELDEVAKAIEDVNFRAANIRAGYVYVISNIGSFGNDVVKIGMTRRLDPMDRIRELGDASVPFNFDVHALFFSKDAVGIESAMHDRFKEVRINMVNFRREFFRAKPADVKAHLAELAGELLQFQETAEALEYRQCMAKCGSSIHSAAA